MITVVVGAQYGGEGKGKICSYLGLHRRYRYVCRTGGVNSSHTVVYRGNVERLRMLPASAAVRPSTYVYGAGSLIHIPTLHAEAGRLGVRLGDILVDPRAGIVTPDCVTQQRADPAYGRIGSTLTGTGYASARRCMRRLSLARDHDELGATLADVPALIHRATMVGENVLVEGHQGAGLSNYHGDYPYTSSRDCTVAGLLSEVGIGPALPLEIILIVKMFPTRNHAGALPNELTEAEALARGIKETGGGSWGVPDKRRRVGKLSWDDVKRAIILNTPSYAALTGFDYAFPELKGCDRTDQMSAASIAFVKDFESRLGVPVGIISTGPSVEDTIPWSPRFATTPHALLGAE